jgi:hypothetical protein
MSAKDRTVLIVSSVVVASLVFIGLGVAIFNAGSKLQTSTTTVTKPVKTPAETVEPKKDTQVTLKSDKYNDFIDGAEGIFMQSCDDGTNTSYCKCTYDWLDNNLTNQEFFDVTIEAQKGITPDEMYDAVKACT